MGIRIRTGIGPLRISIPLTGRRRRRRRGRGSARSGYNRGASANSRLSARQKPTLKNVGAALIGVLFVLGGLGSIPKDPSSAIVGLLVGPGLVTYGIRGEKAANQRQAEEQRLRLARSFEIARYQQMNPRQFEEAIAYLCERDGCTSAKVVGGAGDLGADVIAMTPDGRKLVIQCKRYGPTTKVGSPDMQKFGGTCYAIHNAGVAVLVTTSVFTRQAADYGTRQRIRLYDRDMLAGWASRTGPAPWH